MALFLLPLLFLFNFSWITLKGLILFNFLLFIFLRSILVASDFLKHFEKPAQIWNSSHCHQSRSSYSHQYHSSHCLHSQSFHQLSRFHAWTNKTHFESTFSQLKLTARFNYRFMNYSSMRHHVRFCFKSFTTNVAHNRFISFLQNHIFLLGCFYRMLLNSDSLTSYGALGSI